jgi:RimJ/RimL family protein N-acetyltransferase
MPHAGTYFQEEQMNQKTKLIEVDPSNYSDLLLLWRCLLERPKRANISHDGTLPLWENHVEFVKGKPYREWKVIKIFVDGEWMSCGNTYITKNNEIGIFILKQYQRRGIALSVVKKISAGKELLANIAPRNYPSQRLFKKLGFVHIQNTYRRKK